MTVGSKRAFEIACSGMVMAASLGLFALYAMNDWLLTTAYFLVVHRSFITLLLLAPLLPFFGAAWCAGIAVRRPEALTRRTFVGAGLLLASLFPLLLIEVPVVLVGYLGMPRRYTPAPYPWLHFLEWAAIPITSLMMGATGVWLLVSERRDGLSVDGV